MFLTCGAKNMPHMTARKRCLSFAFAFAACCCCFYLFLVFWQVKSERLKELKGLNMAFATMDPTVRNYSSVGLFARWFSGCSTICFWRTLRRCVCVCFLAGL